MIKFTLRTAAIALAVAQTATAGTDTWFTPLTESTTVMAPNDVNELTSPWIAPAEVKFTNLMSLREAEKSIGESIVRATDLGNVASMIDMIWYDDSGRYIFLPHETLWGAGVSRYDTKKDKTEVLFVGDEGGMSGDWSKDFGAFDPSRVSPNNTVWAAEEWSGQGRVVEYLTPFHKAPIDPVVGNGEVDHKVRVLTAFPLVGHEGIGFSNTWKNKVVYFVDENNSGSIYKMVWSRRGDYSKGQTFALKVDDFNAEEASANWGDVTSARTGKATWVPLTDRHGKALTEIDPFGEAFAGRPATDEIGATPYGRPEDVEVGRLANGNEVLYFAATSESTVYSVEMTGRKRAVVREFASDAFTPKNEGFDGTTASLNSPDNLAQDALGNIYIIEDSPNTTTIGAQGGDVWFARDIDNDGVAESIDHFLSLGVNQSEATGMVFNPVKPNVFAIAVQHPASTNLDNVADGFGDAVWKAEIKKTEKNAKFLRALKKAARKDEGHKKGHHHKKDNDHKKGYAYGYGHNHH